jgi:ATP-dependent protease ClpP protease subunit
MAKELHIKVDTIIGAYVDEFGFVYPGFMAFMLDGMLEANPDTKEVVIHSDCPGGDIIEGYRIYNRLMDFRKEGGTVRFINEGMSASMITVIAQAATPGLRQARPASTWMMHKPLYDQLNYVNADDLRKLAFQLDNFEETLLNIFVTASNNSIEQVKAHFKEEIFISSDEAVRRGYLDSIIEADGSYEPKKREAKAVAFCNPTNINQPENNTMAETKKPSKWEAFVALAKNLFEDGPENTEEAQAPAPVATETDLESGEKLYHDGELAEGTAVFTDVELTTPAADGNHKLANGNTVTVAEGKVSAITEAESEADALAEAKTEIQNLKDQLSAAQATATEVTNLKAQVTNLTADLAKAKKVVPGGGNNTPTPPQNFKGDNQEPEKMNKEKNAFKALAKK